MKAITIWQPWATLIMEGAKPCEFRPWAIPRALVHQRVVIHAGARKIDRDEVLDLMARLEDGTTGLKPEIARPILQKVLDAHRDSFILPLASGLGTVMLGRPRLAHTIFKGIADSDRIDKGQWAWPVGAIRRFDYPIPMRGAQGFWEWPEAAAA